MLIDAYRFGAAVAPTCDPYWINTVLLLQANQGALAERTGGLTTTIVGTPALSSDEAKFDTTSLYLDEADLPVDGTDRVVWSDSVNTSRFTFPGPFTWELWIAPEILVDAAANCIFSNDTDYASTEFFSFEAFGSSQLQLRVAGDIVLQTLEADAFVDGTAQWQHIAITRDDDDIIRIFVDGVMKAESEDPIPGTIGGVNGDGDSTFSLDHGRAFIVGEIRAYTDQIRVTKRCRYTSNFSVPTEPYSLVQCDDFEEETFMLIHVEDGSIYERTGFPTVTVVGDGIVSGDEAKFGTQSFSNPGGGISTDYVSVIGSATDFEFPGPLTWEGWFYVRSLPASLNNFFTNNTEYPNAGFIQASIASSGVVFLNTHIGAISSNPDTPFATLLNQWVHLAVTRDGDDLLRIWLNGEIVAEGTLTGTLGGANGGVSTFDIGRAIAGDNGDLDAFFEEIRVTKGCRYTEPFTPPAAPFPPFP